MILIRKRPDGVFERVYPDGSRELFTLPPVESEGVEERGEQARYPLSMLDDRAKARSVSGAAGSKHP